MASPLVKNYLQKKNKSVKIEFLSVNVIGILISCFKHRSAFFSGLILLVFAASCSMERKLAQGFISNPPPVSIQLFSPETLFKYNHKGELIPGFDSLNASQQDSALFADSRYIQFIDDSTYLDKYVNAFIDELRRIGFKVFVEQSLDTFLQTQPQAYLLSMAQVEIDEYLFPLEDSASFGDSTFYKSFDLNGVDASTWFEVSKINSTKPVKTVLRSTLTATDGFQGRFLLNGFSSDVLYKYKVDSLTVKDLYELASYAGRQHADYLFDYFMNQYVSINMPQGTVRRGYLHYDHSRKFLGTTEEEKFEVISSQ
jgi:hypothetical protein